MFRYWLVVVAMFSLLLFATACSQQSAPVEFLGGKFFGKDSSYNSKGEELPKFSERTPAILSDDIAYKYNDDDYNYGVTAEIAEVEQSDIDITSDLSVVNTTETPAPIEYASNPLPEPITITPADNHVIIDSPIIDEKPRVESSDLGNPIQLAAIDKPNNFIWPVKGKVLSKFNAKENNGINISANKGEPIRSSADGVVVYSGDKLKSYGKLVIIKHSDGYLTAYGHANDLVVDKGETVVKGQLLGFVGSSGNVDKSQLHFAIRKNKVPIDPLPLLKNDG